MISLLAQIVTDTTQVVNDTANISMLEMVMKGGWTMVVLFLLSLVTVYIFVERMLVIVKSSKDPAHFIDNIRSYMKNGDVNAAKLLCDESDTPFARMISKGLSKIGKPLENIAESVENVGKIEIFKLEKNLSTLATISGAAPMIGFLGTVLGMIKVFMSMRESDGVGIDLKQLSGGIYEAMITTAGGLIVVIVAYIGYNYLVSKVEKTVHNMEAVSIDFIDLLQEPKA